MQGSALNNATPTKSALPSPRPRWSLTLWLTFFNAASAFGLISLIAALLYGGLAAQLKNQNHLYLHDEVNTIESMIRVEGNEAAVIRELGSDQSGTEYVKHYIRLMDRQRRVIMETPRMREVIPVLALPTPERGGRPGVDSTWRAADGKVMLATMTWVDLQRGTGEHGILQVALDVTNVDEILVGYRQKIYLVLSFGFLLCLVVGFCIAREATRPLKEMTRIVRRITVTNLEERITGDRWPRELSTLADALNLMMDRLEDSFSRLYTSARNLSHKMRTPLTIMRGEAEVALSGKRSTEELQDTIASSLEEITRLSRLADSILFLANAEMGKFQTRPALLNCRDEADQVVDFYTPLAEEKGIALTCQGRACLLVDATLFRKSVAALISNALTYSPSGAAITLNLRQRNGFSGELSVTDTGVGMADDEILKVFDRFYRIYATRHMDPHGTGLGLPIVQAIMELHDGTVSVHSSPGKGTTVTLVFPGPGDLPAGPQTLAAPEYQGS